MTKFTETFATFPESSALIAIMMVERDWVCFKAFSETIQKIYSEHTKQIEFTEFGKSTENRYTCTMSKNEHRNIVNALTGSRLE